MKLRLFWKALHPSTDPVIEVTSYQYDGTQATDYSNDLNIPLSDSNKFFQILHWTVDDEPDISTVQFDISIDDTSVVSKTAGTGTQGEDCYLTAESIGSTTITITGTANNKTVTVDTFTINVVMPTHSETITIDGTTVTDSASINASSTSSPIMADISDATIGTVTVQGNDIIWTSSDPTIASLTQPTGGSTGNGAQIPIWATGAEGTATLTVTTVINSKTYTLRTITITSEEIQG